MTKSTKSMSAETVQQSQSAINGGTPSFATDAIKTGEAATTGGLRFAMPKLENPTIVDLNTTGDKDYFQFRPDEDVMFIGSTETRTLPKLQTDGGRNIVLVGGEYAPQGGDAGATIYFTNLHGSAYVEGVHVDQSGIGERDGIAVYGAEGAAPTVTLQNVLVENVKGSLDGVHGDVFQTHGPVGDIRMYNVTGSGDYQGIFIPPQKATGSAYLENVNLKYTSTDHAGYLLWLLDDANEKPFPVTLKNVNVEAPEGWNAGEQIVWPKASLDGNMASKVDGNEISWPGLPFEGHVTVGAPKDGDYVKAENVGVGYKHAEGTAATEDQAAPASKAPVQAAETPAPTAETSAPASQKQDGQVEKAEPAAVKVGTDAADTLKGVATNDLLIGGKDGDHLSGGAGQDSFLYRSMSDKGDVIHDFEVGKDNLDLRPLMASIKASPDKALGHYVTFVQQGENTAVMVDATGQGHGEQLAVLEHTNADQLLHFADHWM